MNRGEKMMKTVTPKGNKFHHRSSESLIPLETMAAAAKVVQARGRHKRHRVTVVSCELDFESDAFQSKLAPVVQAEGL
jgi:hypothetical protein